jgi:hypothetical protein
MNRRSELRFARPALELLESRDLPSFLFPGTAVSNLVQPLTALNQDLQTHKSDLLNVVNTTLLPNDTPFPPGKAGASFAQAVGDFQSMLNDQHAIDALVKADLAFIQAAASSELTSGDPIDFIVLNFGALLGINVQAQFTSQATAADNAVNDPTVQNDVAISWTYTIPPANVQSFTLGAIKDQTTTPPF